MVDKLGKKGGKGKEVEEEGGGGRRWKEVGGGGRRWGGKRRWERERTSFYNLRPDLLI